MLNDAFNLSNIDKGRMLTFCRYVIVSRLKRNTTANWSMAVFIITPKLETRFNTHYQNA